MKTPAVKSGFLVMVHIMVMIIVAGLLCRLEAQVGAGSAPRTAGEATRARSKPEFIGKIECGLQELEETVYWIELLIEAGIVQQADLRGLLQEAGELTSIAVFIVPRF